MFVVIVVVAGVVLFTALTVAVLPLYEVYHFNNSQIIANEIAVIQRAVDGEAADNLGVFYRDGYSYPASGAGSRINILEPAYRGLYFNGYERYKHIKTSFSYKGTYSSDRNVKAFRFAMWFESPFGNFLGEDYTKAGSNKCGTGAFSSAQNWCGDNKSLWAKLESHAGHYDLIQTEQHRLYRLSRKFYRYYEENGAFDSLVNGGQPISNLVVGGGSITSSNCSGVWSLDGIPIGCQDMFNAWGDAIYLHRLSGNSSQIYLTNSLGIEIPRLGFPSDFVGLAEEINIDKIHR